MKNSKWLADDLFFLLKKNSEGAGVDVQKYGMLTYQWNESGEIINDLSNPYHLRQDLIPELDIQEAFEDVIYKFQGKLSHIPNVVLPLVCRNIGFPLSVNPYNEEDVVQMIDIYRKLDLLSPFDKDKINYRLVIEFLALQKLQFYKFSLDRLANLKNLIDNQVDMIVVNSRFDEKPFKQVKKVNA